MKSRTVLFLCTGNYYRSRFAAALFNHLARPARLEWSAISRGLKLGWPGNVGPISPHTLQRMSDLTIDLTDARQMPMACTVGDLERCELVIALKEAEHRPMLTSLFAGWEERVTYWHVHDVDLTRPEDALREIEYLVGALVESLRQGSEQRRSAAVVG